MDEIQDRHSEEVQEIITKTPNWIMKWGIVLLTGITIATLLLSAFIHYPETVAGKIKFQESKDSKDFYGTIEIPAIFYPKIRLRQQVIINLAYLPPEDTGMLTGLIEHIESRPNKMGLFALRVKLETGKLRRPFKFEDWMLGDAKIVTQDHSVLQRMTQNMSKSVPY